MSTRIVRMVRFGLVYGAAVLCHAGSVGAQSYTITDLGTLGGNASRAYAVNGLGQVVGEATTVGGNSHAFLWLPAPGYGLPAGMNDLGTLGGSGSAAFGINNLGFVVGQADTSDQAVSRAFQWDPTTGVMTDLGTPAGPSLARATNDFGEIVGTARDAQGFDQAFYRSQDGWIFFFSDASPGDATSVGVALGYAGNVNFSGTYFFPARAFKFGGETGLLPLDDLGDESFTNDMNGLNQAVGSVTSKTFEHAALWIFTSLTDLGTLGGTNSRAQGINDSTHIVGVADTAAETEHAFLWQGGAMIDLNDLLPANSGWALNEARDINENGVIVGTGTIKGQTHAFLLRATSTLAGQSVNIDYGEGAGTPPSDYAAAGSPGVWNALSGPVGTPEALVGLDGSPITATVTLTSGAGGPTTVFDNSGTSGGDEQLLDDYTSGGTDAVGSIFFSGLENGLYEVIVYAWTPGDPDVFTAVWEHCTDIISQLIGGTWPGQLVDGITQARFTKTVFDGTMEICTAGGLTWEGAINGIQLLALNCNDGSGGTCTFPPDGGPCDGTCPRFYYDTCTEQCEPFSWGCCLGNANNFETMAACNAACPADCPGSQPVETFCADTLDNDCDGCTDGADSDCGGSETNCADGFDNDCDGLVDSNDPDCCPPSSAPTPAPILDFNGNSHDLTANRFLIFAAGDPGQSQSIRVTFKDLAAPYDIWNGTQLFVGLPGLVSNAGALVVPDPDGRFPNFTAAQLQCQPLCRDDWLTLGELHVFHEGVVPSSLYNIDVVDCTCDIADKNNYSPALSLSTSVLGDTLENLAVVPPGPPDNFRNIVDVLGVILSFSSAPSAPRKPRSDIEPNCLDLLVNITDALITLKGFSGVDYAELFPPKVTDLCQSPCPNPVP